MNDTPQVLLQHHLRKLKLPTFQSEHAKLARQCAAEGKDHVQYLLRLCELELIERERRMIERRIKAAKFPATKSLDSFDFRVIPSLNKALTMELARCEFVDRRENVIALGPSGTGKTHVALGLGLAACQKGRKVGFTPAAALVHELMEAVDDRRLQRLQKSLATYDLLIIDELGFVPLSKTGAELLFEVISQRYDMTVGANGFNHRRETLCKLVRISGDCLPQRHASLPCPSERGGAVRIAELHASRPGSSQSLLRPPRGSLALLLRHERHDPDGQIVRLRHVAGQEPHPAVPERQQECRVAGEPVELGDNQGGTRQSREVERLLQLRPVRLPPALHLGEPRQNLGAARCGELVDRLSLCLKPQPRLPLPGRRNPLIGDEPEGWGSVSDHVHTCLTFIAQVCTSEESNPADNKSNQNIDCCSS